MQIDFALDGHPASFHWDTVTGRADLTLDEKTLTLQNPTHIRAHFSLSARRSWRRAVNGHEIEIVKERPLLFAGFRPNRFKIFVDGMEVVSSIGR